MTEDYRCCCNLLHVKTGTWIIVVLQFISVIIGVAQGLLAFIAGEQQKMTKEGEWAFIIQLISLILWLLLIIMAMFALIKNRARLLFPHFIATVILLVIFVVEVVLILIGGASFANIIFMLVMALFLIFCLWIEYRCWRYLSSYVG